MFAYIELFVLTITSPQVMLLFLTIYILVRHPDIVKRISSMKIFGAEINLENIEKSLDAAVEKISNLESKVDNLKADYLKKSSDFDPIAPAKDLHKVGTELKAIAAALDDIDFVGKYLMPTAKPDQVYAAACAIQVRPQAKFLDLLLSYIEEITNDKNLCGIRPLIGFKLLQSVEKIITTDARRETKLFSKKEIQHAINVLKSFARHQICNADRPTNGQDGIPSKVEKLEKKFLKEVSKREI